MRAVNPANGEQIEEHHDTLPEEVDRRIEAAHAAHLLWRDVGVPQRAQLMREAAKLLRSRQDKYATLITREMGKPIRESRKEIEKCAWVCDYYAEKAEEFLRPQRVETDATTSFVAFEPLGVILAVMPWNFPFWQVFRFAAPALTAGNAAVLKHASNVPGCSLAMEHLFSQAGFPRGLFASLLVDKSEVDRILEHDLIAGATLTGSVRAGRAIATRAGALLKKTVLELGGSDPYVVLEDADLAHAVEVCTAGRLINTGQSCIAAKRLIVVGSIHEKFERMLVARMARVRMGDPLDEDTELGPLARDDLREKLHHQVERSVSAGARLLLGGVVPAGPGYWYPPTVLADVRPGMPAFDEEVFGPVAALIVANDASDAIRTANRSQFGLGAAVFTEDRAKGEAIATHQLDAGFCAVNTFVRSDPRLPFGGVKASGYGRELSSFGIREFVNIKTVYVK